VGFPADTVEPREKRAFDSAFRGETSHTGRLRRAPVC
jgi:hypothetical protein